MYKTYLLFLLILLPFDSFAATCVTTIDDTCASFEGCEIIEYGGMGGFSCEECQAGYYNTHTSGSTSCKSCETDYDFSTVATGKQWSPHDITTGNTECPWICTNNWYQSGDNCIHCPSNSTTDGTGSISINDCKCVAGKYMGGGVCRTCPANATGCPRGATAATVQCQSDYTKIISPDGVVTCAQCPQNAILNGATCECNIGYYATTNGTTTTCTQCPFGTTTVATGATSLGDCQMNNTTLFCDANGENCMNLIPSGITINAQ